MHLNALNEDTKTRDSKSSNARGVMALSRRALSSSSIHWGAIAFKRGHATLSHREIA